MANKRIANMKRDPQPQRGRERKREKSPDVTTYKVENIDLGKVLSNRMRLTTRSFGKKEDVI